jgi:hypothetical protein
MTCATLQWRLANWCDGTGLAPPALMARATSWWRWADRCGGPRPTPPALTAWATSWWRWANRCSGPRPTVHALARVTLWRHATRWHVGVIVGASAAAAVPAMVQAMARGPAAAGDVAVVEADAAREGQHHRECGRSRCRLPRSAWAKARGPAAVGDVPVGAGPTGEVVQGRHCPPSRRERRHGGVELAIVVAKADAACPNGVSDVAAVLGRPLR